LKLASEIFPKNVSPLRGLATVVTIGTGEYQIVVDPTLATVSWADETQARPETGTPTLVKISIPVGELYANPKCSQTLLDDSSVDLGAWLTNNVSIGMSQKEGAAFVAGDGIQGKPHVASRRVRTSRVLVLEIDAQPIAMATGRPRAGDGARHDRAARNQIRG
jgi:predicted phage gp36 major capsid-like protein